MLYSEKESNIIDFFRSMCNQEICLFPVSDDTERIVSLLRDPDIWNKWKDSSDKQSPPPDFYCDEFSLMMEVMRVDDHGRKLHGNIINPTYEREHRIERELIDNGIYDIFPNLEGLYINAKTDLPTVEDHNYSFYLENFRRTIKKHITHIPNYKKNHPGCKLIFFIFDESSAYVEKGNEPRKIKGQTVVLGQQHWFFADKAFTDCFMDSDIDYIVWCAPFKYLTALCGEPIQVHAAVIDIKAASFKAKKYDASKMMSAEE